MPAQTESLGPGELSLGEVGGEVDFSCQLTAATLTPSVDQDDDTPVLCGDTVPGNRRYTFELEMSVLQDWRAEGITAFSYDQRGKAVPFRFSPDTNGGPEVTGTLMVDPMNLGGEVEQRATADWTLSVVGDPTITWDGQAGNGDNGDSGDSGDMAALDASDPLLA